MHRLMTFSSTVLLPRAMIPIALAALLVGCASPPDSGDAVAETPDPIPRHMDSPLQAATDGQGGRDFAGALGRGSLSTSGQWQLRSEVRHASLRCATYAVGARFGVGNANCSAVDWRGPMEWAPGRTQCNGATLVHSASGRLELPSRDLAAVNCARVAIRCRGACG